MKKLFLHSLAFAAVMAGPAVAADMPVKAIAPSAVVYDWSGVYIGGNIGGIWSKVDRFYPNLGLFGIQQDYSSSGSDGIFGFHVGAQQQWGNWVLGVEAAWSTPFRGARSRVAVSDGIFGPSFSAENNINDLFTIGPRLGYAWDRWMIFGTGGYAVAALRGGYFNNTTGLATFPPGTNLTGTTLNNGWFAGGGVDYVVHKGSLVDFILGLEYQHFDVRSKRAFTDNIFFNAPVTFDHGAVGDIVRVRLTVKTHGYPFFAGR